jgi:hypothetical protein
MGCDETLAKGLNAPFSTLIEQLPGAATLFNPELLIPQPASGQTTIPVLLPAKPESDHES